VSFSIDGLAYNAIAVRPDGTVRAWGNPEIPEGVDGVASAYAGLFKSYYLLSEDGVLERFGEGMGRLEEVRSFDIGPNLPALALTREGMQFLARTGMSPAKPAVELPLGLRFEDIVDIAFDQKNCALLDRRGVVHFAPGQPIGITLPAASDLRGVVDIECPGYSQYYLLYEDGRVGCLESKWVEPISARLREITDAVAIHAHPRESLSVRHADGSWSLFARPVPELPHWIEELEPELAAQVHGAIDVQIGSTHVFALMPLESPDSQ
jgi:hypothetical protein